MTAAPDLHDFADLEEALRATLIQERWYADKDRRLLGLHPAQVYWVRREAPALAIVVAQAEFEGGATALYQLVLGLRPFDRHLPQAVRESARRVGGREPGGAAWAVYDAFSDLALSASYLSALATGTTIPGLGEDQLRFRLLHPPLAPLSSLKPSLVSPKDQSQSSVLFGDEILIKVLRRVSPGISPEVEILEALDAVGFQGIAKPLGVIEASSKGLTISLSVAQSYLRNGTDGFSLALTSLRDLYGDRLLDADGEMPLPENAVAAVQRQGSSFAGAAAQIGTLTGEMHLALARLTEDPDLAPRPLSQDDLRIVADDLESLADELLGLGDPRLEPLAVHAGALRELSRRVVELAPGGAAIRIHGDYHLGQLLRTDQGWHALDFEGRPALPIAVRRRKGSPLQDVAGMLRSFDYAATVALRQQVDAAAVSAASLEPYGRAWSGVARDAFLSSYLKAVKGTSLLPGDPATVDLLLTCLQASQALYEVDYELRSRPDWVSIPLEGIARLLSTPASA